MSSKATTSLVNKDADSTKKTAGAGPAGSVAAVTATVIKAVATTPAAVAPVVARAGAGATVPATAGGFDRSVVTSLGK